jgi:potassium efflux system protein
VVTVGEVTGTVSGIRARSTHVVDADNKEVIIPNKAFITQRVTNWTLSNKVTRMVLKVGVACGNDIENVRQVLLATARSNPEVMTTPAPSVYFVNFGDSSLDFEIRVYVDALDKRSRVRHEIYRAVGRALDERGIEMPFPQRDLHIRTAPGLAEALRTGQSP